MIMRAVVAEAAGIPEHGVLVGLEHMLCTRAYAKSANLQLAERRCMVLFDLGSFTMDAAMLVVLGSAPALSEVQLARAGALRARLRRRSLDDGACACRSRPAPT